MQILKTKYLIPAGDKGLCVMLPDDSKVVIRATGRDLFTLGFWTGRQIGLEMSSDRLPDAIAGHIIIEWDKTQLSNGKP